MSRGDWTKASAMSEGDLLERSIFNHFPSLPTSG